MPKAFKTATVLSGAGTVIAAILYGYFGSDIFLTLAITFGTTFYHLGVRLVVGCVFNVKMHNSADYTKKWYQLRAWESKLYTFLNVKSWKNKMPTFYPETFSVKTHTWDEIAQTMCQSELVHEVNVILSFVPIIASIWFDSFFVFLITSICGALFDLTFVIMQRYNRARIVKIIQRKSKMR